MHTKLDPLTLSTVWSGLLAIAEETGIALRRASYSSAVREADDFSVALLDTSGRMISQGIYTPGHLGAMPNLVKTLLRDFFPLETWKPGDCVATNDPAMGAGHLPDIYMTVPIFWKDQLIAFSCASVHHVDVGGPQPGSIAVNGVIDTISEGLYIPPIKLWDQGVLQQNLFNFILCNVRDPHATAGDLRAQRNSQQHASVTRVCELFDRYGKDVMDQCFSEIISRTETALMEEIRRIPNGVYRSVHQLEDYGPGTDPIRAEVSVTVSDEEIVVDFTGSSDQVAAGINCYLNYTRAHVFYALKCVLLPQLPWNEGATRLIKVQAPEGSYFNPKKGAPSSGRHIISTVIFESMLQTFAKALPDRVAAAFGGWLFAGWGGPDNPRTGRPFTAVDIFISSHGAVSDRDGLDLLCGPVNTRNTPVEIWESEYPLLVEELRVVPDSGGAGKYRGGVGVRRTIKYLVGGCPWASVMDKMKIPPFGLEGGKPGLVGSIVLNRNGKEQHLEGKTATIVEAGDRLTVTLAGGGGYGNAFERNPEHVLADVIEEKVTIRGAREDYGVAIDPTTHAIDHAETARLRRSMTN
jgi:N-methylhydantoinase B